MTNIEESLRGAAHDAAREYLYAMEQVHARFSRIQESRRLTDEQMLSAISSSLGSEIAGDWAEWLVEE